MTVSGQILLKITNVADKNYRENKHHILCSMTFFFENLAVCKIIWKNMLPSDCVSRTRLVPVFMLVLTKTKCCYLYCIVDNNIVFTN